MSVLWNELGFVHSFESTEELTTDIKDLLIKFKVNKVKNLCIETE